MPTARRSIATCAWSRRGRRPRRRREFPTASTARATAPSPARPPSGRRTPARRSAKRMRRAGCRSWSAAPGFTSAPCSTASPRCPTSIREVRAAVRALPVEEAYRRCGREDPEAAARLRPSDTTRVARALEVVRSTGRTLARLAAKRVPAALAARSMLRPLVLSAAARLALRRAAMLVSRKCFRMKGLREVSSLLARNLDPALPVMRAIGVREIAAFVRGDMDRTRRSRRGGKRPAAMPSANIPGSPASRRRTGRA